MLRRTVRNRRVLVLLLTVLLAACSGDDGSDATTAETERAAETGAAAGESGRLEFDRVETVVEGLQVPWALAFADETTFLVTERPGRVRVVEDGRLRPQPAAELEVVAEGEAGLLGIALHPAFPEERWAYVSYTAADGNRVSRFRVGDDFTFEREEVLLTTAAGAFHDGGRIAFGPDGLLYVATGDTGRRELAADNASLAGKVLRLTPEGGVPDDNPFAGSPVFSYGHRNPQGFDWDAEGRLYASEHGPTGEDGLCCHDEVNLVEAGRFYGWPFFAASQPAVAGTPPAEPVEPIAESGADETWAPAGLAVHDDEGVPTTLFVATLRAEQLLEIVLEAEPRSAQVEVVLDGLGRLRAADFGPDGCLYLTTSNTDGRGEPRPGDDRVLRLCPR